MKIPARKIIKDLFHPSSQGLAPRWLSRLIKLLITLAAMGYIYYRLRNEPASVWENLLGLGTRELGFVLLALLLVPVNLAFETAKWRIMVSHYYPDISFFKAYQAVLAGITSGIFTPNGVGAYAGRVLYLESGKRTEAIVLTFLDRICLMLITLGVGIAALEYLIAFHYQTLISLFPLPDSSLQLLRGTLWVLGLSGLSIGLFPQVIYKAFRWLGKKGHLLQRIVESLKVLKTSLFLKIFSIGTGRYLTFTMQYYLLMLAFGYEQDWLLAWMLIWSVFFIKSIIPSVSLTELGIRESVAIAVMGAFSVSAVTAFSSTFVLYLFNLILPALAGMAFVQRLKV